MNDPFAAIIEAVKVHVVNAHEIAPAAAAPARPKIKATCYTVSLSAGEPVAELLPQDPSRHYALVQPIDKDVVICHSSAQAQAAANSVTGLPAPSGTLVPTSNTSPYRIDGGERMWFTNDTATGAVSVMTFVEVAAG